MNLLPSIRRSEPLRLTLPFRGLDGALDRLFDGFFDDEAHSASLGAYLPRLDLQETKDELIVRGDLPGLSKEDVQVKLEGGVLTISGERKHESREEKEGWLRIERGSGAFQRSVYVGEAVDEAKAKAEVKDGVLTVRLPKRENAKPRSIEVR